MGRTNIAKGLRSAYKRPMTCLRSWVSVFWYAQSPKGTPVPRRAIAAPASPGRQAVALADSVDLLLAEIERHLAPSAAHRIVRHQRQDSVTADLIDVGLLFVEVFGRDRGENFFRCTVVEPSVYRRVLLGPSRSPSRRGDDKDIHLVG